MFDMASSATCAHRGLGLQAAPDAVFSDTMPAASPSSRRSPEEPEKVEIAPQGRTVDKVDQRVYFVPAAAKRALLSHLLNDETLERVIVFTRTKRGANRVAEALEDRGVRSEAIHGNKSQNARQKALDNFSRGRARVLVATDLASRGIDVTGVTHASTTSCGDAESYVHRIGRHRARRRLGHRFVVLRRQRARPAQEHRAADQPAHAVVQTPANEDMPAARRSSQGRTRRARRRRASRASRQRSRSQARQWQWQRSCGRGGHRPFGERPRRSPVGPAEISGRAAIIARPAGEAQTSPAHRPDAGERPTAHARRQPALDARPQGRRRSQPHAGPSLRGGGGWPRRSRPRATLRARPNTQEAGPT